MFLTPLLIAWLATFPAAFPTTLTATFLATFFATVFTPVFATVPAADAAPTAPATAPSTALPATCYRLRHNYISQTQRNPLSFQPFLAVICITDFRCISVILNHLALAVAGFIISIAGYSAIRLCHADKLFVTIIAVCSRSLWLLLLRQQSYRIQVVLNDTKKIYASQLPLTSTYFISLTVQFFAANNTVSIRVRIKKRFCVNGSGFA